MSPLVNLLLLIALAAFVMIAWRYWQMRADEKLRNNPPPRRIIEVSLPIGVADSATSMARFYRKAAAAALGDKSARRVGARQIDFVYLVDVPAEGALPRMRCRIYADPDKMDAVKKALKSSFQDAIDVIELPEDDLLPIAKMLRPEEKEAPTAEEADYAPEDIRALLEQGGEEVIAEPDNSAPVVSSEPGSEPLENKEDAFLEEDDSLEEEGPQDPRNFTEDNLGREQEEDSSEEVTEEPRDPRNFAEDNLGREQEEEIEEDVLPPKPRKSGGVETIDFIISEEEEPPKF